jgi:hypothetical protein
MLISVKNSVFLLKMVLVGFTDGHLTDEHCGASARHVGWREVLVLVVGNDP